MNRIFDVPQGQLITAAATQLKSNTAVKAPAWAAYAKTGTHKQRPPTAGDWWQVRAAAVLRTVYKLGPVGTQKLRTKYGGKKNRGVKTEHHFKGSGSILRHILQQLELAGLVKQAEKGVHKGRIITGKGQSLLEAAAKTVMDASSAAEATQKEDRKPTEKKQAAPATAKKAEAKEAPAKKNG